MSEPVYTPNSHKYKEQQKETAAAVPEKRVQKVVKSPVKTKTNELRKFADIFISEDVKNVKSYILMDVLVPAIKKAIYDIVTNGIDMFLYGGNGKGKSSGPSGSKVSYRNFYDQRNSNTPIAHRGSESVKNHNGFEYEDLVFDNRGDAEAVKDQMLATIERYGMVTVADLYDMCDQSAPYTSQKFGWTNLSSAEVIRVRGDYVIKLPRPEALN